MNELTIFQMALGLTELWFVESVKFNKEEKRLDMNLNYKRGTKFVCPICGQTGCRTYDSDIKTWRHLNFFQHEAYIHAKVPRCDCPQCGPRVVPVPWARPDSGFTLLLKCIL
jgi:transposase